MTELYRKSFWYEGKILEIGMPRNDVIMNTPKNVVEKVYQYFNINKEKSIVIYAPTFRKDLNFEVYKFSYQDCIEKLNQKFNKNFVMLIRLHPNISEYDNVIEYNENILNATNYPDVQELLAACEVGITDYSSIMFDLSMAEKPVFLFGKDFEIFKKTERELDFQIEELPFLFAKTEDELLENINEFSIENYYNSSKKFYDKLGLVNNKNASKKIVEIIKEKIAF